MANELTLLPNPDNIPGKVSSGYQRQNTKMYVLQTGLDTMEPYDNGEGIITIPDGGIVEVNGALFVTTIGLNVVLTKPDANTAYWIAITDNGDGTASPTLVTRPGAWDPAMQGCYLADGRRTLSWVSLGIPDNITETPVFSQAVKGTWDVNLQKGWYYADLRSGMGNGDGGDASGTTGGTGGVASVSSTKTGIFIWQGGNITVKIGGDGGMGGNGGNGGGDVGNGGGGGGGSGEGEIIGFIATKIIKAGKGGKGANTSSSRSSGGGGGGGSPGGSGGIGNSYNGNGGGLSGGSPGGYSNGGGAYGGINGTGSIYGGGGGGQGLNGKDQPDGAPGGYCNLYKMEDVA
jgi:hypothetical protein